MLIQLANAGKFISVSTVEDFAIAPNKTGVCKIIMIKPIPLKTPEITGYGTYLINFGADVKEIMTCKTEAMIKIKIISEILPEVTAKALAKMIAIGAVGPDMIGTLLPAIPTMNERIIAPQIPAEAPKPEATPNARACGNAIIPAIIAPKTSPFINEHFFKIFSNNFLRKLLKIILS